MQGEQQQQERTEGRSLLCFRSLKRSATFGGKSCSFWRQIPFLLKTEGRRGTGNKVQTLMRYSWAMIGSSFHFTDRNTLNIRSQHCIKQKRELDFRPTCTLCKESPHIVLVTATGTGPKLSRYDNLQSRR